MYTDTRQSSLHLTGTLIRPLLGFIFLLLLVLFIFILFFLSSNILLGPSPSSTRHCGLLLLLLLHFRSPLWSSSSLGFCAALRPPSPPLNRRLSIIAGFIILDNFCLLLAVRLRRSA